MLTRHPLTTTASGIATGILIYEFAFQPRVWQAFLILSLCLCCVLFFILRKKSHFYLNLFLLSAVMTPFGIFLCSAHNVFPENHIKNLPAKDIPAVITGKITEPVYIYPADDNGNTETPGPRLLFPSPVRGHFVMEVKTLKISGKIIRASGLLQVNFYNFAPSVAETDSVTIAGLIKPLRTQTNPGQFDYAKFMQRKKIFRTVSVTSESGIIRTRRNRSFKSRILQIRANVAERVAKCFPEETAAILNSLVLGAKGELDNEFMDSLMKTGTVHFFAVSGLHLALLIATIWFFLLRFQVRDRFLSKVLIAIIILYVLLVGFQSPLVRSAIMALAYIGADLAGRKKNAVNAVALSAIVILIFDTNELFSMGFQLSFAAVLAIIILEPMLERILFKAPPEEKAIPIVKTKLAMMADSLMRGIRTAFATSLSACIGTLPIVLYHFHLTTLFVVFINILLSPIVTLILIAGLISLPLLTLPVFLWYPVYTIVQFLSSVLMFIVERCAAFKFGFFYMPDLHLWALAVYYALIAGLYAYYMHVVRKRKKPARKRDFAAVLSGAAIITVLYFAGFQGKIRQERLAVLDVGKGCASCVFFRDGRIMVYDTGTSGNFDVGRNVMAPYLWKNGFTGIDALVLSHPDIDHISGVLSLVDRFSIKQIWVTPFFDTNPKGALLKNLIMEKGFRGTWLYATDGTVLMQDGNCRVKALAPAKKRAEPAKNNDLSMVLKITCGGKSILFAGDAEIAELSYLAGKGNELKSDILMVPHHGGETSFWPPFIDMVSPKTAIVSTSNSFIFKKVLDYYAGKDIELRITADEGAVEINQLR
ncbi:MAG: DNA internalization-related competence protein ComEC/Rec2 [Planctomycetes bacterium]|nr:DNA internalization-related competence protein ComEC/Rec2 [Planctomycetota bacterium]